MRTFTGRMNTIDSNSRGPAFSHVPPPFLEQARVHVVPTR